MTHCCVPCCFYFYFFIFNSQPRIFFIIDFKERRRGGGMKERKTETLIGCLPTCPTGDRTCNLLMYRSVLQPIGPPSQTYLAGFNSSMYHALCESWRWTSSIHSNQVGFCAASPFALHSDQKPSWILVALTIPPSMLTILLPSQLSSSWYNQESHLSLLDCLLIFLVSVPGTSLLSVSPLSCTLKLCKFWSRVGPLL